MERSTMLNGKIHYFDWAIFNSYFDIAMERSTILNGKIHYFYGPSIPLLFVCSPGRVANCKRLPGRVPHWSVIFADVPPQVCRRFDETPWRSRGHWHCPLETWNAAWPLLAKWCSPRTSRHGCHGYFMLFSLGSIPMYSPNSDHLILKNGTPQLKKLFGDY